MKTYTSKFALLFFISALMSSTSIHLNQSLESVMAIPEVEQCYVSIVIETSPLPPRSVAHCVKESDGGNPMQPCDRNDPEAGCYPFDFPSVLD